MPLNQPMLPGLESSDQNQPFTVNVNRYLELDIEKQTQANLDKYIEEKREFALVIGKLLLPTLTLMAFITIGAVSYWQITSFKELKEKNAEVEKKVEEAKKNAEKLEGLTMQAQRNLAKSEKDVADAGKNLDKSFQSVKDMVRATEDNTNSVLASQNNLLTAQKNIMVMQNSLRQDIMRDANEAARQRYEVEAINYSAKETFNGLRSKTTEAEQNLVKFNQKANEIEHYANLTSDMARKVAIAHNRVFDEEGDLQRLKEVHQELIQLGATATIWVYQRKGSAPVSLPDLNDPKRHYTIKFWVDDIEKRETSIYYNVKRPNEDEWLFQDHKGKNLKQIEYESPDKIQDLPLICIPNSPYEVKVEFIIRNQGDDYLVLMIRPQNKDKKPGEKGCS